MSDEPLLLPTFRETLKRHPDALKELPETTRDRYRAGMLPRNFVRWLLRHPQLLYALAEDAKNQDKITQIAS